nr:hypothetical protein Iba_scaffold15946CG0590 [Ipomoea batatas]
MRRPARRYGHANPLFSMLNWCSSSSPTSSCKARHRRSPIYHNQEAGVTLRLRMVVVSVVATEEIKKKRKEKKTETIGAAVERWWETQAWLRGSEDKAVVSGVEVAALLTWEAEVGGEDEAAVGGAGVACGSRREG